MNEHPAVMVVTTPLGHRKVVLASRPRLQVIDVLGTWEAEHHDVAATAHYFDLPEDAVRAVLAYCAENKDAVDRDMAEHLAAQESFEARARQPRRAER